MCGLSEKEAQSSGVIAHPSVRCTAATGLVVPQEFWGHSSVGRAPALQAGGRQFESDWLHHEF